MLGGSESNKIKPPSNNKLSSNSNSHDRTLVSNSRLILNIPPLSNNKHSSRSNNNKYTRRNYSSSSSSSGNKLL